ncbi:MAG TPA: TonB-dependent receptor, partial [Candidatus Dormibacteraeota bacterium]|nr:TonB-dependent receptor [Candidatus Dormibacteraeota bacterium]
MPKFTFWRPLIALFVLVAMLGQGTWALAGTTGSLTGQVVLTDNNAPVAGAKVEVTSPSQVATTTTDAKGNFTFLSLAPDTYTVTVEKEGYQTVSQTGVAVFADTSETLTIDLLKVIGKVTTRAASALVKPGTTADIYSVSPSQQQAVQGLGGGGGLNNAYSGIASVPGVYVPQGQSGWAQSVYVRGADYTQLGYEYDGVPVQRAFDAYPAATLSALGQQELQVYTGSQPIDAQSTGLGGYINQVIKTGTYPGFANVQFGVGGPAFYHQAEFEIGGANPSRLFTYYLATAGYNQEIRFGSQYNGNDLTTRFGTGTVYNILAQGCGTPNASAGCYANTAGIYGFTPAGPNGYALGPFAYDFAGNLADRETVANLHFGIPHRKDAGRDDVQFLYDTSTLYTYFNTALNDFGYAASDVTNGTITTGGMNCVTAGCGIFGPFTPVYIDSQTYGGPVGAPLTASQLANTSNYQFPNTPNHTPFGTIPSTSRDGSVNDATIVKLQYQHNMGTNAYLRVYGYTFYSDWMMTGPNSTIGNLWGVLPPDYELSTHTRGLAGTFADQINSKNLLNLTASYTQASTTRWNNLYFYSNPFGSGEVAALVDSTNPTNGLCYGPGGGATAYYCGSSSVAQYQLGGPGSGPLAATSGTTVQNAGTFTCGSGPCEYFTVDNGTYGVQNTVSPKFTAASISDSWKPTDKLLVNLGLRYDNYTYDLSPTTGGPARQLWLNSYNAFHCYSPSAGITSTATPNSCPAGTTQMAFSDTSAASTSFSEVEPRVGFTYTVNPLNVVRFSYGKYAQPADSAYQQYDVAEQNLAAYDAPKFYSFGFTNPGHAIPPAVSYNTDFSWEHQVKGSDLSWKVSPFYRTTNNQLASVLLDPKTNFVSAINVGKETAEGVELLLQKGDFNRDGLAGQLTFTYTHAFEKFQPLQSGNTVVDGLNLNVLQYNQYTSYCAQNPTSSLCSSTKLGFTPVATGPCYDTAGNPVASAATCTAADVQNPYWNATPQSLFSADASYPPFNQFPSSAGATGVAGSFIMPYTATLVVNYKRHKWDFTPSLELAGGGKYGTPLAATGIQPGTCTGALAATGTDPRNPNSSGAGSLYDAQTCSGAIGIPDPYTGQFDSLGAFTQPTQLSGNLQISYQATPRVQLVLTMVNLYNGCFGGSNEPWNT